LSYPFFERVAEVIGQFINLLAEHGVDLRRGGAAEGEALAMIDVIDMWKNPARRPTDPRAVAQAAIGFVDLAGKVVGVKDHSDFGQSVPHLRMPSETTVLRNAACPVTDAGEVRSDNPGAETGRSAGNDSRGARGAIGRYECLE
jgi:hypothetical protein